MGTVRRFLLRLLLLLLLVGFSWAGDSSSPEIQTPRRPNIILITLDTTRADHMGFLGSQRALTPHLDSLRGKRWSFPVPSPKYR